MLKGIPKILSPELLKALCEMGHGDTLCIGDGNFPAATIAKDSLLIRADGHGVPEVLEAILQVFPLDAYVEKPALLMDLTPGDVGRIATPIWDEYRAIIAKYDERGADAIGFCERYDFYDEAKKCYCIIATSEPSQYANILLQKGIVH